MIIKEIDNFFSRFPSQATRIPATNTSIVGGRLARSPDKKRYGAQQPAAAKEQRFPVPLSSHYKETVDHKSHYKSHKDRTDQLKYSEMFRKKKHPLFYHERSPPIIVFANAATASCFIARLTGSSSSPIRTEDASIYVTASALTR